MERLCEWPLRVERLAGKNVWASWLNATIENGLVPASAPVHLWREHVCLMSDAWASTLVGAHFVCPACSKKDWVGEILKYIAIFERRSLRGSIRTCESSRSLTYRYDPFRRLPTPDKPHWISRLRNHFKKRRSSIEGNSGHKETTQLTMSTSNETNVGPRIKWQHTRGQRISLSCPSHTFPKFNTVC